MIQCACGVEHDHADPEDGECDDMQAFVFRRGQNDKKDQACDGKQRPCGVTDSAHRFTKRAVTILNGWVLHCTS